MSLPSNLSCRGGAGASCVATAVFDFDEERLTAKKLHDIASVLSFTRKGEKVGYLPNHSLLAGIRLDTV
jgi:hypothetical protein